jgi:hypothetical protein
MFPHQYPTTISTLNSIFQTSMVLSIETKMENMKNMWFETQQNFKLLTTSGYPWRKFVEKSPMKTYMVKRAFIFFIFYFYVFIFKILYNKNKVFMWHWNILGQVRLISGPRFCHLGGCRIGLAETDNGLEWTDSDRHTDGPSELIYRIGGLE